MPYALQVFQTADNFPIRTVIIDGEPWFVFADACRALDYQPKNGTFSRQSERLEDDQKRLVSRAVIDRGPSPIAGEGLEAPNGASLLCTNESGLYTLILRSEKPSARDFRRWLTTEVLPAIRRTGSYSVATAAPPSNWQPYHDRINAAWGAVPEGYFSIFKESAAIVADLITHGVKVDHKTIPDISFGTAWSKEWAARGLEHEFGPRVSYAHSYPPSFPQSKSNPQWAHCYPEEALPTFRRWVRHVFLKEGMPKYLQNKVAKGDIAAPIASAVIKAIAATAPKPLR